MRYIIEDVSISEYILSVFSPFMLFGAMPSGFVPETVSPEALNNAFVFISCEYTRQVQRVNKKDRITPHL
jgi:hypothetical protein